MMENKEEGRPADTPVFSAFKKLKVETEWDEETLKGHAATVSPAELFLGERTRTKSTDGSNVDAESKLKSPTHSTFKHRTKPYSKDKLHGSDDALNMDKLSFIKEECKSPTCPCNLQTKASTKHNYAHHKASKVSQGVGKRNVIREARLKLHHSHKDQQVVLRAARLRMAGKSKTLSTVSQSVHSPKLGNVKPEGVFGSAERTSTDFGTIASGSTSNDSGDAVSVNSYQGNGFERFRTAMASQMPSATLGGSLDLKALDASLEGAIGGIKSDTVSASLRSKTGCPLHPGKCPRPCSCSHQARLDDWSEEELACYFDEFVFIPKKMSRMAEMMYT